MNEPDQTAAARAAHQELLLELLPTVARDGPQAESVLKHLRPMIRAVKRYYENHGRNPSGFPAGAWPRMLVQVARESKGYAPPRPGGRRGRWIWSTEETAALARDIAQDRFPRFCEGLATECGTPGNGPLLERLIHREYEGFRARDDGRHGRPGTGGWD